MKKNLLSAGSLLALVGAASCSDVTPVTPTMSATSANRSVSTTGGGEVSEVSPILASMNRQLAASGAKVRIAKAELIRDGVTWNGASSTLLIANDRDRGIGAEWVPRDPRRDGRVGVSYAVGSSHWGQAFTRDNGGVQAVPDAQLDRQIEEAMSAWRGQSCSAPITRSAIAAGTDPDILDDVFRGGAPGATYAQPADIVQGGWQPGGFFRAIAGGPDGDNIIGITFTFVFTDADDVPTDIDRNGKQDVGLAEIYYNAGFAWSAVGGPRSVDFYSILTHETGHSLGLGHFGKVFVTKHAMADGSITIDDIKYAPLAIMNAVYIAGRGEIAGTDHSSFCQIWSSVK